MKLLDTSEEAKLAQLEVFRSMRPKNRLNLSVGFSKITRMLLLEGVRRRCPEYDERQARLEVIRLTLPDELFHSAYPDARGILDES